MDQMMGWGGGVAGVVQHSSVTQWLSASRYLRKLRSSRQTKGVWGGTGGGGNCGDIFIQEIRLLAVLGL
jgi:hypothetical protein